jgi:hypothetical protein
MAEEEKSNIAVEDFLGWNKTAQDDSRLSYTPEDGSKNLYSSWEEFLNPNSPWAKYYEEPGDVFDREYAGRHLLKREHKRNKFLNSENTIRQRKIRGIELSERVFYDVEAVRSPLPPDTVLAFAQPNGKRVGVELGYVLAILAPSQDIVLSIANASRSAPGGGLQMLADILGKPVYPEAETNRKKRFEHAYTPRVPVGNEGV